MTSATRTPDLIILVVWVGPMVVPIMVIPLVSDLDFSNIRQSPGKSSTQGECEPCQRSSTP